MISVGSQREKKEEEEVVSDVSNWGVMARRWEEISPLIQEGFRKRRRRRRRRKRRKRKESQKNEQGFF